MSIRGIRQSLPPNTVIGRQGGRGPAQAIPVNAQAPSQQTGTGQRPFGALYSAGLGSPTGTTSTTFVMMGLGSSAIIKPTRTGNIIFCGCGRLSNSVGGDAARVELCYGTGTAPANGAAVTGTIVALQEAATLSGGGQTVPFNLLGGAALTVGTTYWFDLAVEAVTGGTASVETVTLTAFEL